MPVYAGKSCDDAGKVAAMTLKEPPGCNLRSNGPKGCLDDTTLALDSVVIITGQMQPSIFARGGFRARGQGLRELYL